MNTIAIEVPITMLTNTGTWLPRQSRGDDRRLGHDRASKDDGAARTLTRGISRPLAQVQRMGNPLINELVIGTGL